MKKSKRKPAPAPIICEALETRTLLSASLGGDDLSGVPHDMLTDAYVFIGDHSRSNTEKWRLQVGSKSYGGSSQGFGEVTRASGDLKTGESYALSVSHSGTNRDVEGEESPDYDLRSWIDDKARPRWTTGSDTPLGATWFVEDPSNILRRRHFGEDTNPVAGASTAFLHVPQLDLQTDSDNDGEITGSNAEQTAELDSKGGKVLFTTNGDVDGDPTGSASDDLLLGKSGQFGSLTLEISDNLSKAGVQSATTTLTYDDTLLRIWSDATSSVIPSGGTVSNASAGNSVQLWVEALTSAAKSISVLAETVVSGSVWSGKLTDIVHYEAVDPVEVLGPANDIELTRGDVDDDGIADIGDFDGVDGRTLATLLVKPSEKFDLLDFSGDFDGLQIKFVYEGSSPEQVQTNTDGKVAAPAENGGPIRIWRTDINNPERVIGDYINPNEFYLGEDFDLTPGVATTFYVEGIEPTPDGLIPIKVEIVAKSQDGVFSGLRSDWLVDVEDEPERGFDFKLASFIPKRLGNTVSDPTGALAAAGWSGYSWADEPLAPGGFQFAAGTRNTPSTNIQTDDHKVVIRTQDGESIDLSRIAKAQEEVTQGGADSTIEIENGASARIKVDVADDGSLTYRPETLQVDSTGIGTTFSVTGETSSSGPGYEQLTIRASGSAGYPWGGIPLFQPDSPNVDQSVRLTIDYNRYTQQGQVFWGTTVNNFPAYELVFANSVVYFADPTSGGPGPVNLNTSHTALGIFDIEWDGSKFVGEQRRAPTVI